MCGGAQKVLDMTVEYAKIRQAFGRPIGSYQGVKHKAADMLVDVENSKSITYYAAWAMDEGAAEGPLAVSMAKAYVSDAYRRVSAAGIQLHGGIGFTWEHDLHLYFKRAKGSEFTFGDATYHRERVAQLVNLYAGASIRAHLLRWRARTAPQRTDSTPRGGRFARRLAAGPVSPPRLARGEKAHLLRHPSRRSRAVAASC